MDRALAFYRDRVGLAVESTSPTFSFLDAGSVRIVLNAVDGPVHDESDSELVIEVADVVGEHRRLAAAGVPFEVALRPVMEDGERELLAAHFRDPDGHLWSVTGWAQANGA